MPIKYPVRKYLGKYESWLLHLYGRRTMLYHDKYLERFFSHFPETTGLEQFGTPDVNEYKRWREEALNVSTFKLMQEIKAVEKFFRFLIEDQGLPLSNPAKPFVKDNPRTIVRKNKDSLRLEEYKRLLEVCIKFEPRLVHWMVWLVQGVGTKDRCMSSQMAGRMFKRVAEIAGMPYVTMCLVKKSLRYGLWREIIKDWANVTLTNLGYNKVSDSNLYDPKLAGDAFGYVQVSTLHEWTTIRDSCNRIVSIDGIPYQEHRSEPETP